MHSHQVKITCQRVPKYIVSYKIVKITTVNLWERAGTGIFNYIVLLHVVPLFKPLISETALDANSVQ
jgi:hypothetical protein